MKKFTVLLFVVLITVCSFGQQDRYSRVKVFANENQMTLMAKAGIDVTEGIVKKGEFLICDYSQDEISKISGIGLNYEILIEDVVKFYIDSNTGLSNNVDDYKDAGDYEVPENFEFGSMSGHATFVEIVEHLDNMASLFPNLITAKATIGQSIEGRELWMVKISDNPGINEAEPQVLYTALHHAREPAGVMSLLFYMYYLLENYDNDPLIQTLVDNTEMYFVPVVNPDGYVYNQTTNPNGGGMWRKNRRNNGGGVFGIDLNRNYGYMWGYDDIGSSPDPESETYRGSAAFSEPEIFAMKNFCENHEFKIALNYHTYGNYLLYPWGFTPDLCPDDAIFSAHSNLMIADNNYNNGPGYTTIYNTNGGSDDWMYGEQATKEKIFAYTPELGGDNDGFWCAINRIIPIAQENMIQNLLAAAFTGGYAEITDLGPILTNQINGSIDFEITRLGLSDCDFTVSIVPVSNGIISTGDPLSFAGMGLLESQTASLSYSLDPSIVNGTSFSFILSVDNGSFILSDTIERIFGIATVLFEDDCNTIENWTSTFWGLSSSYYHSSPQSITDSPDGNYPNNASRVITLNSPLDINNCLYAELDFWARWEIETGYDYVQVLISTDNGTSWTPLAGKYTTIGNENQAAGEPLYDGFQTDWVQEEINISQYIGNNVKFRFKLKADAGVIEDGFYFDDLSVRVINESTIGTENKSDNVKIIISDPYPNPASRFIQFSLNLPENSDNCKFLIFNSTSQQVYSETLQDNQSNLNIYVGDWDKGIYYYTLEGENFQPITKKLMIL